MSEPVPVVNLTFMEPIASPAADEIVTALSKSHARAKSLGVPVYRLHTDRERSFTTKSISTWCLERQVSQTLNAGDEPEANGRVEGEVLQFKRRLRLLLADSKANTACWPRAARHGTEERLRSQMRKLGAPCKEMPKFAVFGPNEGQKVASSQRRGTFCTLQNYEDYPLMTHGWVALDEEANWSSTQDRCLCLTRCKMWLASSGPSRSTSEIGR